MGRGLSPLQLRLIEALRTYPQAGRYGTTVYARPKDLIAALGLENTAATRTAVSKSLRRLAKKGLISVWVAGVRLQGSGYRYGPPIG